MLQKHNSQKKYVSEFLFHKVADLGPASLSKRNRGTGAFLQVLQNFLISCFLILVITEANTLNKAKT